MDRRIKIANSDALNSMSISCATDVFDIMVGERSLSFDDSFEFLGKRTTGGKLRRVEIPQYTQVGNAVPPLLAKAIAIEILKVL